MNTFYIYNQGVVRLIAKAFNITLDNNYLQSRVTIDVSNDNIIISEANKIHYSGHLTKEGRNVINQILNREI